MKKNNQGFTLVELLAVIVVLALVITIAVPSTMRVSNKIKENMFCSKLDFIENAAKLYGEDRKNSLNNEQISIETLVTTGYLKKDQEKKGENGFYIQDPRNKNEGLDTKEIQIIQNNNRVVVHFWDEAVNLCKKSEMIDIPSSNPDPGLKDKISFSNDSSVYEIIGDKIYILGYQSNYQIKQDIEIKDGSVEITGNTLHISYNNGTNENVELIKIGSGYIHSTSSSSIMVNYVEISSLVSSITCPTCTAKIMRNNQEIKTGYPMTGDTLVIKVSSTNEITRTITVR